MKRLLIRQHCAKSIINLSSQYCFVQQNRFSSSLVLNQRWSNQPKYYSTTTTTTIETPQEEEKIIENTNDESIQQQEEASQEEYEKLDAKDSKLLTLIASFSEFVYEVKTLKHFDRNAITDRLSHFFAAILNSSHPYSVFSWIKILSFTKTDKISSTFLYKVLTKMVCTDNVDTKKAEKIIVRNTANNHAPHTLAKTLMKTYLLRKREYFSGRYHYSAPTLTVSGVLQTLQSIRACTGRETKQRQMQLAIDQIFDKVTNEDELVGLVRLLNKDDDSIITQNMLNKALIFAIENSSFKQSFSSILSDTSQIPFAKIVEHLQWTMRELSGNSNVVRTLGLRTSEIKEKSDYLKDLDGTNDLILEREFPGAYKFLVSNSIIINH
jgi:hypothetical protein